MTTPMVKMLCCVTKPSNTVVAPTPNTIGQIAAPGGSIAASEVATATASVADKFESRAQTLKPASRANAIAAEVKPTMPIASPWEMP